MKHVARTVFGLFLLTACSSEGSAAPDATVVAAAGHASGGSGGSAGTGQGGSSSGGSKSAGGAAGDTGLHIPSGGSAGQMHGHGGAPGPYMVPDGFTHADVGGWLLGMAIPPGGESAAGSGGATDCGSEIRGIVRDFKRGDQPDGHPDFETFTGSGEKGIVEAMLGSDRKPVYVDAPHQLTTNKANFDQWYRDVPGVNDPYFITFSLAPSGSTYTFASETFFPLDGAGFGAQGFDHNFSFTTEVHTAFLYSGGETFTFSGDDDLWVFVNDRLAIDLGGLHSSQTMTITLDDMTAQLGLAKGSTYPLDLFHAERHTEASHFRIETTLTFVDCGSYVPSDPH